MPDVYMIAGPNGAGKTTAAYALLKEFLQMNEFVNADEIARGLSPLNAENAGIMAGEIMLMRMKALISSGKDFAFESTAAGKGHCQSLQRARQLGYRLNLIFLWLPSADLAVERVALRVSQGGHNIPETDIRRRYGRGLRNLVELYLPLADRALVVDARSPLHRLHEKPDVIIDIIVRKDEILYYNDKVWLSILEFVEQMKEQENDN